MRPEKFDRLKALRSSIRESELLNIKNMENLQYINLEIIRISPKFVSWVRHRCKHDELIRDIPEEMEETNVKVSKEGDLTDSSLWMGVCNICGKIIIGVQPLASEKFKLWGVYETLERARTEEVKLKLEGRVSRIRKTAASEYLLYAKRK